jgi:hypothetical protein
MQRSQRVAFAVTYVLAEGCPQKQLQIFTICSAGVMGTFGLVVYNVVFASSAFLRAAASSTTSHPFFPQKTV